MRGYQRITDDLRAEIVRLYWAGESYRVISEATSVSQAAISMIVDKLPEKRKKYKDNNGQTHIKRDSRFIGYDGESETVGRQATYVLLANSDGDTLYNRGGLSSVQCLDFLSQPKPKYTVRCFFRGHYDINHIVNDLPVAARHDLFHNKPVYFDNFHLRYFPHKIFTVRRLMDKVAATYYDVWGFFQSSFEQALKDVLHIEDDLISSGKAQRANFDFSNSEFIKRYNMRECELLSQLMLSVEQAVTIDKDGIKITPRSWHGAGAVAGAYLNNKPEVKVSREIETALNRRDLEPFYLAYGGGRIELKDVGHKKNVFAYDINSAYPAAMSTLPDLTRLRFVDGDPLDESLTGVVKLEWDFRTLFLFKPELSRMPGPFMWRSRTGYISYPGIGRNWVWVDEYRELANTPFFDYIKVLDKRLFEYRLSTFSSDIPTMYEMRRKLKDEGDGRQMGLKLTLNSLYGKFAQTRGKGRYRVVIWAGKITAATRAKLLRAGLADPDNVFAYATDCVYSTKPLPLPMTKTLGDWDCTKHPTTTLLLPGLGELENEGGKPKKLKVRGMPLFDMQDVVTRIHSGEYRLTEGGYTDYGPLQMAWVNDGVATVSSRIFVTHTLADSQPSAYGDKRGRVITPDDRDCPTKTIAPFNNLKRHYDWIGKKNPHKRFRLDEGFWSSRMPMDLREEQPGVIVDSYPMSALKFTEEQLLLMEAEESADE